MPEVQTFLQKKKDQNTGGKDHRQNLRNRRKKTAMISMAAVGVIPFFAPPLGTDSSVYALAAVADSIDGLYDEDGGLVHDVLVAAMLAENEEARGVALARNETYKEAARHALEEWKITAGNVLGDAFPGIGDGLHLLGLGEEDALFEDDVIAGDLKEADGAATKQEAVKASATADGTSKAASISIGGAGVRVSAAMGGAGTKAITAAGTTGTKATAASGVAGTKASAATGEVGTKAPATKGETATKVTDGKNEKPADKDAVEAGVQSGDKQIKEAEEAFHNKVDLDSIPAALNLEYNANYAGLKLSAEQLTVLETIVEAEAGDEDAYGKILVANVVLNRVLDEEFPDTVKGVVFQNNGKTYQFSPVRKGGRYYTVKVSKHTKAAVARALSGEDYSDGALYFFARRYTSEKKANWFDTSLRKIVEYGCHEFFGNK
jgi:spore germination cell wall hydrolase CwlJ-like protein